MFKYLKRQTSRRRSNSHECDDVGNNNGNAVTGKDVFDSAQKRHSLRSTTSFCDEVFLEELTNAEEESAEACSDAVSYGASSLSNVGIIGVDEEIFKYRSRLSMTLSAIVNEPNCLSYFVQFLETKNALPLIKFYLDIENFKRAALTQIENELKLIETPLPEREPCEGNNKNTDLCLVDEKNETAKDDGNEVPELKSLCDLSMRKPLTDDEKSQIYAETNKQLIKCTNNNNNSRLKASSELSLCIAVSDIAVNGISISAISIKDAIAIYQKYLIVNAQQFVELPISILAHISLLLCKRHDESDRMDAETKPISASCFDEARDYVLDQLERNYVQDFLQSSFYCKYCVELIESDTPTDQIHIYDVLYSEVTLFYFMEYLEQQQERECLDFWIAAINFRKSFANTADSRVDDTNSEVQADAMIIYERFFSLQSECRLWMSDKLRCRVEQNICALGQVAYAFDLPLQVTAKYLEQKYFTNFLKSQLFKNYLNELQTKINNAQTETFKNPVKPSSTHKLSMRRTSKKGTTATAQHRKSMSDCTHISQHNTLLAAMDTSKPTNMNIDARQLTNPNLLWQRSCAPNTNGNGGLKFGRVNSLGRYERDFEAVDAAMLKNAWSLSISGNKIKNAMRKLVNLPEDKVQEEIAWQVAEMIVKDVTNVTLNGKTQAL